MKDCWLDCKDCFCDILLYMITFAGTIVLLITSYILLEGFHPLIIAGIFIIIIIVASSIVLFISNCRESPDNNA
ncbi:unnamed protein product [Chironomus riparius]|uniref:Uncharacterized protein n=1 Tax=Chironomus riparius TaxID=315576 RepID=A0A9N9WNT5_9DIPT|nr:unnamed protein product [Chironomus riparius]